MSQLQSNRNLFFTLIIMICAMFALSACGSSGGGGTATTPAVTTPAAPTVAQLTLSGSVGDGPVVGATITVTDANGQPIRGAIATSSNAKARYNITQIPANSAFPLTVTSTGGLDQTRAALGMANTQPPFIMRSVIIDPYQTNAAGQLVSNITPFSTLVVQSAQQLGGITAQNISLAQTRVNNGLGVGLETVQKDLIATDPNVFSLADQAVILKANEAIAEIISRTQKVNVTNMPIDSIITQIATDLTDGVINGSASNGQFIDNAIFTDAKAVHAAVLSDLSVGIIKIGATTIDAQVSGNAATSTNLSASLAAVGSNVTVAAIDNAAAPQIQASAIRLNANNVSAFQIVSIPASATAAVNSPNGVQLTMVIKDVYGTPLSGQNVTFFDVYASSAAFAPSAITDITGFVSIKVTDAKAENVTIMAKAGLQTAAQTMTFGPGAVDLVQLANNQPLADGLSVANFEVIVTDAGGNPMPNEPVTLTTTGSALFAATSGITDVLGKFKTTITNTVAEDVSLGATSGLVSAPSVLLTFASVASQIVGSIQMLAAPQSLNADGITRATITATVLSQAGGGLANQNVTFGSSGGVASPLTGVTDAYGRVQTFISSNIAGQFAVSVQAADKYSSVPVSFTPVVTSIFMKADSYTVVATTIGANAPPAQRATVTVTVKDANNQPIIGRKITFSSPSSSLAMLNSNQIITDAAGQAVLVVSNQVAETVIITATAGTITATANITFEKPASTVSTVTLQANPPSLPVKGSVDIYVSVSDRNGSGLANRTVTLTKTSSKPFVGQAILSSNSVITDSYGNASITLTDSIDETVTINASSGGVDAAPINIVFNPQISLVLLANATIGTGANADGINAYDLTAQVLSASGSVSGAQVIPNITGNGIIVLNNLDQPGSGVLTTDAGGVVHFSVSDLYALGERVTVSVTAGGKTSQPVSLLFSTTIAANPPVPQFLTMIADTFALQSSGSNVSTINATVLDVSRAAIPGQRVNFAASSGKLSAASGMTDINGQVSITLQAGFGDRSNQIIDVYAQSSGVPTIILPFQVMGTKLRVTSVAPNTSVEVNGVTSRLTVTALDSGNVPISGAPLVFSSNNLRTGLQANIQFNDPYNNTLVPSVIVNTDVIGNAFIDVYGIIAGTDSVLVRGLNSQVLQAFTITNTNNSFAITAPTINPYSLATSTVLAITVREPTIGNAVVFATSFGHFTDNYTAIDGYSQIYEVANPIGSLIPAHLTSNQAGMANVQIYERNNPNIVTTLSVAISAPAASASQIALQAVVNVLSPDIGSGGDSTLLTATVRDINGQPVGGAEVHFGIQGATGGGEFVSPVVAVTNSSGQVRSTFTSGTQSSAATGVTITGTVVKNAIPSNIKGTTAIVIGGTAGSVTISQGSLIENVSSTEYSLPMSVMVTDSNGGPVSNNKVTLSLWPSAYSTGFWVFDIILKKYTPLVTGTYPNEDVNENLTLNIGEDANGDGVLTPHNSAAGTLPSVVTTDVNGLAHFNLLYQKNSAVWVLDRIRASTQVQGSEAVGVLRLSLPYDAAEGDAGQLPESPFSRETASIQITAASPFPADGIGRSVTITVLSQAGSPLQGQSLTFATNSTTAVLSSTSGVTNANGQINNLLLSDINIGTVRFSVIDPIGGRTVNQDINFVSDKAGSVVITAIPVSVLPDGFSKSNLTVLVKDLYGTPAPNVVVDIYTADPYTILSTSRIMTDALGQASFTAISSTPTIANIIASLPFNTNAALGSSSVQIAFEQSAFSQLLDTDISSLVADGVSTATISATVLDNNLNPLRNRAVEFTLTNHASPKIATVITDSSGVAQIAVSDIYAETVTVRSTVLNSPSVIAKSLSLNFTQTVNVLNVAMNPSNGVVVANNFSTASLFITLKDAAGQPISNQPVIFTDVYGSAATFSINNVLSNSNGQVQLNVSDAIEENITIEIRAGAKVVYVPLTFLARVQKVTLGANPISTAADPLIGSTITATVLDVNDAPLANRTVTFSVGGSANLSNLSGLTNAAGVSQVTLIDTLAETVTVVASVSGVSASPLDVTFTPVVNTISFSVFPSTGAVSADGISEATLTINVKDVNGQPIRDQLVSIVDQYANTAAQITVLNNSLTDFTGTVRATVKDPVAEPVTITVSAGQKTQSKEIVFVPTNMQMSVTPPQFPLANGIGNTFTVTVRDQLGQPLPAGQQLYFSLAGSGQNTASLSAVTALTDAQSQIAGISIANTIAESVVLTVSDALLGNAASVSTTSTIQFVSNDPYSMLIAVDKTSGIIPNGADRAVVTATVKDLNGGAVANALVKFATPTASAVLNASLVLTDANGQAVANVTSTQAGTVTVNVTMPKNAGIAATQDISFGQIPNTVVITATRATIPADGIQTATIIVKVTDASGLLVPGQAISLNQNGKAVLSKTALNTDLTGQDVFTVRDFYAESVTLTVQAGAITQTQILDFKQAVAAVTPVAVASSNPLDPYTVPASGVDTIQVTFQVLDVNSAPISNQSLSMSASGTRGGTPLITPVTTVTDIYGKATVTITDLYAESVTLIATADTVQGIQRLTFSVLPPGNIQFTNSVPFPAKVSISGSGFVESSTLEFTIVDVNNRVVQGAYLIDFSILAGGLNGGESLTTIQATSVNGIASTVLNAGNRAGAVQVRASLNSNPAIFADATIVITGGMPTGDAFGLSALPLNISGRETVGLTQTITAFVSDFFSNPVIDNIGVQFQTDFANVTGSAIFSNAGNGSSSATAQIVSAFPQPIDGFVTVEAQSIGGAHAKVLTMALDPIDSYTAYAGTDGGGVFKTTDAGQTWQHVGTPLKTVGASKFANLTGSIVRDLKVDASNAQVLYAATEKGLFLSVNGGNNWQSLSGLRRVSGDVLSDIYGNTAAQGTAIGTDGLGEIFVANFQYNGLRSRLKVYVNGVQANVNTYPYTVGVSAFGTVIAFYAASLPAGAQITADYDTFSGIPNMPFYSVVADPTSYDPTLGYASILYVGTYGDGVWKTRNGGHNWFKVSAMAVQGVSFGLNIMNLAMDPLDPYTLYAGTDGSGLYKTINSASTWNKITGTVAAPLSESVVQAILVNGLNVWIGGKNGIHYSQNGGIAWNKPTGIAPANDPTNSDVRGLAFGGVANSLYAITYGDVLDKQAPHGGVYMSTNAGVSWSRVLDLYGAAVDVSTSFKGAHRMDSLAVLPGAANADVVMVGTEGRAVYRSPDSAQSWVNASGSGNAAVTNNLFTTIETMHSGPVNIQIWPETATYQPMDNYTLTGPGFGTTFGSMYNGESHTFYVRVSDDKGHRLPGGTVITISVNAGKLTGQTTATLADATYGGNTDYIVSWNNDITATTSQFGSLTVNVSSPSGATNGGTRTSSLSTSRSLLPPFAVTSPITVPGNCITPPCPYVLDASVITSQASGGSGGAARNIFPSFPTGYAVIVNGLPTLSIGNLDSYSDTGTKILGNFTVKDLATGLIKTGVEVQATTP
ncbi:MAG: Ig-like domain-containing protein [Mariprofundales bacterium]